MAEAKGVDLKNSLPRDLRRQSSLEAKTAYNAPRKVRRTMKKSRHSQGDTKTTEDVPKKTGSSVVRFRLSEEVSSTMQASPPQVQSKIMKKRWSQEETITTGSVPQKIQSKRQQSTEDSDTIQAAPTKTQSHSAKSPRPEQETKAVEATAETNRKRKFNVKHASCDKETNPAKGGLHKTPGQLERMPTSAKQETPLEENSSKLKELKEGQGASPTPDPNVLVEDQEVSD